MPKNKRLHFKELDALRFFALIPIFMFTILYLTLVEQEGFHYEMLRYADYLRLNSFDFYFFLSSFLLTSLGLREYKYNENFNLKKFYFRRIVRLLPLTVIIFSFAFIFYELILKTLKLTEALKISNSKYWELIPGFYTNYGNEPYIYLGIIWTITLFLLFYFVWGIVLKYFRKNLQFIIYFWLAIGIISRVVLFFLENNQPYNLILYGVPIAIGAQLALGIRTEASYINKIKLAPKKIVGPIYFVGVALILFGYLLLDNFIGYAILPVITCLFFAFIIIDQTFGKNSLFKIKNSKILSRLGKISFGLYVYSAIISILVIIGIESIDYDMSSITTKVALFVVVIVLTFIVSDISYNFIERPILSFKRDIK